MIENLNITSKIILAEYILMGIIIIWILIKLKKKKIDFVGHSPIHPFLFALGKGTIVFAFAGIILQAANVNLRWFFTYQSFLNPIVIILSLIVFILFLVSFINFKDTLRTGLPKEKTKLRTKGIYKISRNPMYFGVYLTSIIAILYTLNPLFLVFSVITIYTHNKVTLAEERFLRKRFGKEYRDYCKKVPRYL